MIGCVFHFANGTTLEAHTKNSTIESEIMDAINSKKSSFLVETDESNFVLNLNALLFCEFYVCNE